MANTIITWQFPRVRDRSLRATTTRQINQWSKESVEHGDLNEGITSAMNVNSGGNTATGETGLRHLSAIETCRGKSLRAVCMFFLYTKYQFQRASSSPVNGMPFPCVYTSYLQLRRPHQFGAKVNRQFPLCPQSISNNSIFVLFSPSAVSLVNSILSYQTATLCQREKRNHKAQTV